MEEVRKKIKNLLQFVFSRLVVTMLLLLLQVVWMFVLFHELTAYADWINFICLFISIVMCAALIR